MSLEGYEVHRAIVHYSNPSTGVAQVYIPALLGAGQVVGVSTAGLTNTDGFWNVPSIGSSVFVAVSEDRTQFMWLTAVGISGSGGDDPSNEPIGHEDRTASYISFDNGTRTFSIQPANGSYVVWCVGLRYEKSTTESVVLPDTTGLYYIYFDPQGVLQYRTSFFVWDQDCPTSYVYWNSATQRAEFFSDERHGITMDWQTHEYLHRTRGAAYANGFDASNFDTSTKNGNTDAQAKLDIDNGTFFDEDLQVDVRHSLAPAANTWEQQLQGPARIPVFYRSGTGYVYDAPTDFPVKQGVTHPVYNSSSGGNWNTTELGANSYGIQWIVATNQLNYPVLSIMGQAQYANVGQAEAASWASMDLSGLPVVEIRVLYKIIFRATGSNTPGCYFDQIDDYRTALSSATSTAAAVVDHGNLTGLGDDDHPQYLTSARGDLLYADINSSPTITLSGHATGSVTLTNLTSGTLTVTVNDDSHNHTIANVDNLQATLDGKAASSHSHSYVASANGSGTGTHTFQNLRLSSQPLTTYGSGVSSAPAYYIGQAAGTNDGWRIYGEGGSNAGGLILEAVDDQDEFIKMRWKKTYYPYSATENTFTPSNAYISSSLQAYSIQGHSNVAGTGNASYHPSGIYSTGTNWLYGTVLTNGSTIGNSGQRVGQVYSTGWLRTINDTGWYNDTYSGGVFMQDTTWVRTYNSRRYYSDIETAGYTVAGHGGIVIGGQYDKSAFNSTYARKHCIQMEVDTYWGGYHDNHTGALMYCGNMNSGSWGTAEWGVRTSNNWGSYLAAALRVKGSRTYSSLGVETALNVHADAGGRLGYYSSRRELKNHVADVQPSEALARICQLQPIDFTWKKETRPYYDPDDELIDFNVHRGFYAEDAAEIDRTYGAWGWVYRDDDSDGVGNLKLQPLTAELLSSGQTLEDAVVVAYNDKAIMADLVGAVQDLNRRLSEMEMQ